jgi:hypothetical protein
LSQELAERRDEMRKEAETREAAIAAAEVALAAREAASAKGMEELHMFRSQVCAQEGGGQARERRLRG